MVDINALIFNFIIFLNRKIKIKRIVKKKNQNLKFCLLIAKNIYF